MEIVLNCSCFYFVFGLSINVKFFGSIPEALRSSSIWQLTILDEIVCLLAMFGNFTFALSKSYTLINVLYMFFQFLTTLTTFFLNQTQWHLFPWWNSCQTFHSWRTVDEHCWKLSLKTAILNWQGWICVNIFYQFGQVKGVIVGNKVHWRILKRGEQENKAHKILRKANISYLPIRTLAYVYRWVRNVCFFGNLACFVFL